jgi:hypothetical protein
MNTKRLGPPNATWRDIKQLVHAWLLVVPMIAVVCYGAARLVGLLAAFWIGVGLVALTGVVFAMLVVMSLVVTHVDDVINANLHGRRR